MHNSSPSALPRFDAAIPRSVKTLSGSSRAAASPAEPAVISVLARESLAPRNRMRSEVDTVPLVKKDTGCIVC